MRGGGAARRRVPHVLREDERAPRHREGGGGIPRHGRKRDQAQRAEPAGRGPRPRSCRRCRRGFRRREEGLLLSPRSHGAQREPGRHRRDERVGGPHPLLRPHQGVRRGDRCSAFLGRAPPDTARRCAGRGRGFQGPARSRGALRPARAFVRDAAHEKLRGVLFTRVDGPDRPLYRQRGGSRYRRRSHGAPPRRTSRARRGRGLLSGRGRGRRVRETFEGARAQAPRPRVLRRACARAPRSDAASAGAHFGNTSNPPGTGRGDGAGRGDRSNRGDGEGLPVSGGLLRIGVLSGRGRGGRIPAEFPIPSAGGGSSSTIREGTPRLRGAPSTGATSSVSRLSAMPCPRR
jgi:hypothetical protein